jgi:hypothetical protein
MRMWLRAAVVASVVVGRGGDRQAAVADIQVHRRINFRVIELLEHVGACDAHMGCAVGYECRDIEGAHADEVEFGDVGFELQGAAVFVIEIRLSRNARCFHERFQLFQNPAFRNGEYYFLSGSHRS